MELSSYAKTLLALAPILIAVLLLCWGLRSVLKKIGAMPSAPHEEDKKSKARIVSRQYLPPQQYVTLLEFGSHQYLVYTADQEMVLLDKFRKDDE